jgi:DNA mismatch repair protein MutL
MSEIIRLLPEHIANQIAAGEVVQRPASVVKELMENAIDAGATRISLYLKDAGKSLLQVIDNGSGMSSRDARMCFERHATSKIREATDLYTIRTMGFRGEAMASIASVAQVQMKTRLHDQEIGTHITIEGNEIKAHEPCVTAPGTSIAVKNLFYNIPARRNFLKSNPVETRHILQEFTRIALAYPGVSFQFDNQGTEVYDLLSATPEKRILDMLGNGYTGHLAAVSENTLYVKINGFIGKPEMAKKNRGDQYFFVNNRYIKSGYLHHAISTVYADLLPQDAQPFYVLWITIDPKHIDINIHPTKTEIKFDDESTVYALLRTIVKKAVSSLLPGPELPLDDDHVSQSIRETPKEVEQFTIGQMNPFRLKENAAEGWDKLFENSIQIENGNKKSVQEPIPLSEPDLGLWIQFNDRYLLSPTTEGLMILDMIHAHQRIIFESILRKPALPPVPSQQLLFPKSLTFTAEDMLFLREMEPQLRHLGFDVHVFGNEGYMLQGIPPDLQGTSVEKFFVEIIADARESQTVNVQSQVYERLAKAIASRSSLQPGKKLTIKEMAGLYEQLLMCEHPGLSPWGKPTWFQVDYEFLDRHFKRN